MSYKSKGIGGFFEMEISSRGSIYHDEALALNTGRNAFEYILLSKKIKHIYVPYYTCEVIMQPIHKHEINYTFYHINEILEPIVPDLNKFDAILYTNYFGLTRHHIEMLSRKTKMLIVDNSQAFYDLPLPGVPTFYSPRKFFGLPDGGFVYNAQELSDNLFEVDSSSGRMKHLLERVEKEADKVYQIFKENDTKLANHPIKRMSKLTRHLMLGIDYPSVQQKRIANFEILHQTLKGYNKFKTLKESNAITCPMVYPFLVDNGKEIRQKLISEKIFVATYWPNVLEWTGKDTVEYNFTENVLCLPVDQRYSSENMSNILNIVKKYV